MDIYQINKKIKIDFERRNIINMDQIMELPKKISGRKPWLFLRMLANAKGAILSYELLEDSEIWPDDHGLGVDHRSSLKTWASEFNKIFGERIIKCDSSTGYHMDSPSIDLTSIADNAISPIVNELARTINTVKYKNSTELCNEGFETFSLYEYIFNMVHDRLWIYGRKNKKIFDRSFEKYFIQKTDSVNNGDFSLRILFLNPFQPTEILKKAQRKASFTTALNQCVIDAYEQISNSKLIFDDICRFYDNLRNEAIIIADDLVFYKNLRFDNNGTPEHLTNSSFFITPSTSSEGIYYESVFDETWKSSKTLNIKELYEL